MEKVIHSDEKKVPDRENAVDEDEFMLAVAEAGGEDYEDAGEEWIVYTAYDKMQDVQKALEDQGIEVKGSELTMVPPHGRCGQRRQEGPAPHRPPGGA